MLPNFVNYVMNVLTIGSQVPDFEAQTLRGESITLKKLLETAPVLLCFGMPLINSSRLVIGYLRRLKDMVPDLHVVIVLQGDVEAIRHYADGYLDNLQVIHDEGLELSESFRVSFVPSSYYLKQDGEIYNAFTGFNRPALNALAEKAAEESGATIKELITAQDNKGDYELAERALSGRA